MKTVPESLEIEDDDVPIYKVDNSEMLSLLSIVLAEFLGTALFVFVACMGCTSGMTGPGASISAFQASLVDGLAIMTAIQISGHISGGHVNPAVTLCALIMEKISVKQAAVYVASQIAGSMAGYALLLAVTPDRHLEVGTGHCVTFLHPEITVTQGVIVELIATIILCTAICAVWDPKNMQNTDSVSLRIGLVVAMLVMAVGPYTGCSMNPARSIGPAVWNQKMAHQWIYWVGPISGGLITGLFYKTVFLKCSL